jgi:hypothetical protein
MKAKMRETSVGVNPVSANEQVRSEIQSFLEALNSYPDRFASDPQITFEQHRGSLTRPAKSQPRRRPSF